MSSDKTVILAYGVMEPDASVRDTTFTTKKWMGAMTAEQCEAYRLNNGYTFLEI